MCELEGRYERKRTGAWGQKQRSKGSGKENKPLQTVMGSHVRGHETKFRAWRTNRNVRIAVKERNKKDWSSGACGSRYRHLCWDKGRSDTAVGLAWSPSGFELRAKSGFLSGQTPHHHEGDITTTIYTIIIIIIIILHKRNWKINQVQRPVDRV